MKIPFNYSGQYFQDVPILIKAVPNDGYYFVRWIENQDTNSVINFSSSNEQTLTPLFLENGTVEQPAENAPFLEVYPNPTNDLLQLRFSDTSNNFFTVRIYNALGQLFFEKEFSSQIYLQESTINVGNWSKGVYFLETKIGEKEALHKLILTN